MPVSSSVAMDDWEEPEESDEHKLRNYIDGLHEAGGSEQPVFDPAFRKSMGKLKNRFWLNHSDVRTIIFEGQVPSDVQSVVTKNNLWLDAEKPIARVVHYERGVPVEVPH